MPQPIHVRSAVRPDQLASLSIGRAEAERATPGPARDDRRIKGGERDPGWPASRDRDTRRAET